MIYKELKMLQCEFCDGLIKYGMAISYIKGKPFHSYCADKERKNEDTTGGTSNK